MVGHVVLFALLALLLMPAFAVDPTPPQVDDNAWQILAEDLRFVDLAEGDGPAAATGNQVMLRLKIWLEDGQPVLIMEEDAPPIPAAMGTGQLLPGLDRGLQGMRVGGSRYLMIPPALAYGASPPPGAPAGTLLAVVELAGLDVTTSAPAAVSTRRKTPTTPPAMDGATEHPSGMVTLDLRVGDGPRVEPKRTLHVEYTGWTADGGVRFDSSYERNGPFKVALGGQKVIPGWEIALGDMRVGGHRVVKIPSYLAYAGQGQGDIPSFSDLIFEIELMHME
jgi:FKBP-type peptidyl-prolyl cis-trans isomerase